MARKMPLNYLKNIAVFSLIAVLLSACYVPARFDIEIELTRRGYYSIVFDGYLVDLGLYDGLRNGKVSGAEEQKKIELIKTDLTRDSSVKEFSYFKTGHFKVHWEKKGDLLKAKMVTFLRRNEKFFTVKYDKKKGLLVMEGTSIADSTAKRLNDAGLGGFIGQIRVKTDAKVVNHNATRTKGATPKTRGEKILIWDIKSVFDKTPNLALTLR